MQTGENRLFPPGTAWRMASAAFLVLAGVVIAALAVASGQTDTMIISAVLVVVFGGLAFYLFRLSFPARLRGVTVSVNERDLWRGEDVEVRVEVSDATDVEVGLVCMEYYEDTTVGPGGGRTTVTLNEPAHEEWRPVRAAAGAQTERFTVPSAAPFSFSGKALSFVWSVKVRRDKAVIEAPFVVHP